MYRMVSKNSFCKELLTDINIVELHLEYVLTLSRDRTRQVVAVVHIDNARASSAAANFALTFYQVQL